MKPGCLLTAAIVAALLMIPAGASAQRYDGLEAGIYALVGDSTVRMEPCRNGLTMSSGSWLRSHIRKRYEGASSGLEASGTFILVAGHGKRVYIEPFTELLSPCYVKVLRLESDSAKDCRVLDCVEIWELGGIIRYKGNVMAGFEWDRIGEYSYEIKVHGLTQGEYAIAIMDRMDFMVDYGSIYGFTVK